MENSVANFNPEQSAELLKGKLQSFNKMTVEIVEELFKARKFYNNQGYRSDLVPDGTRLDTYEKYIEYTGLPKRTAYNWLERYVPEQNKLLSFEEFQEKKQLQEIRKQSAEEQRRSIFVHFYKTGVKLEGWDSSFDKEIERQRVQKEKDIKNANEARDRMRKENEEKETIRQKNQMKDDLFSSDFLNAAAEKFLSKSNERKEWQDKIRVSDSGKEDSFINALMDYMETLPDDNRRIEACYNIIKVCKNISIELQRKK